MVEKRVSRCSPHFLQTAVLQFENHSRLVSKRRAKLPRLFATCIFSSKTPSLNHQPRYDVCDRTLAERGACLKPFFVEKTQKEISWTSK